MFLLLVSMLMAHANEKYSADLYDLAGKTKLFTLEAERTDSGGTVTYSATYKDMNGQVAAQEKGESKDGVFIKYEASRPPLEESGSVVVNGGKLIFNYDEKGKKSEKKATFEKDTLYSGTLVPFLTANCDKIAGGEAMAFPYVVWYRQETVRFKFTFDKEEAGKLIFKMEPTNFIYRSMVNPLYFTLDKASKKLISIKGRTMPKSKVDGSWKDTDAFVQYK